MTTFTHPNLLAAIQKACPELMEKTPGCQVYGPDRMTVVTIAKLDFADGFLFQENDDWSLDLETYIILGHEPQLHHVLRAIDIHENDIYVDTVGGIWEEMEGKKLDDEEIGMCFRGTWNLSLGLYGQSTEVKDFLESLLVSK